jgi:lysophospholipase L1-like esterase
MHAQNRPDIRVAAEEVQKTQQAQKTPQTQKQGNSKPLEVGTEKVEQSNKSLEEDQTIAPPSAEIRKQTDPSKGANLADTFDEPVNATEGTNAGLATKIGTHPEAT